MLTWSECINQLWLNHSYFIILDTHDHCNTINLMRHILSHCIYSVDILIHMCFLALISIACLLIITSLVSISDCPLCCRPCWGTKKGLSYFFQSKNTLNISLQSSYVNCNQTQFCVFALAELRPCFWGCTPSRKMKRTPGRSERLRSVFHIPAMIQIQWSMTSCCSR